jgi:hypothetical protein
MRKKDGCAMRRHWEDEWGKEAWVMGISKGISASEPAPSSGQNTIDAAGCAAREAAVIRGTGLFVSQDK